MYILLYVCRCMYTKPSVQGGYNTRSVLKEV